MKVPPQTLRFLGAQLLLLLGLLFGAQPLGAAGLIGRWTFDECSGTLAADSAGTNHGTLVNGPVWKPFPLPWGGCALKFDGNNDRVRVGTNSDFQLTGSMTICGWARNDLSPAIDTSRDGRIVSKRSLTQRGYELHVQGDTAEGLWVFKIATSDTGTTTVTLPGARYQTNQWVHVAGVYDAAAQELRIYTNGQWGATRTAADGVPAAQVNFPTNPVCIGARDTASTSTTWWGRLDDVRMYDVALSESEISAIYGGAVPEEEVSINTNYPVNVTASICSTTPATFEVRDVEGTGTLYYQWYDDATDMAIPGETERTFAVPPPLTNGAFYCVISNNLNSVTSSVATLTLTNDTVAPTIVSANTYGRSTALGTSVSVLFSEQVSQASAETTGNYQVSNAASDVWQASSATLQADNRTVVLALNGVLPDGSYTLSVTGVQDMCSPGNTAPTTANFQHSALVGYWKFNEGTGTVATDSSIYGRNGNMLLGAKFVRDPMNWCGSPLGDYSLFMDGGNDRVVVTNAEHLKLTGAMTLCAWVYNSGKGGRIIAKSGSSSARGWELFLEANVEQWGFRTAQNASTPIGLQVPGAVTNQWVHVAGVYNPSDPDNTFFPSMRLYINGTQAGEKLSGVVTPQYDSINNVTIGSKMLGTSGDTAWNGLLDEVRVYSRVLSAAEIAALVTTIPPRPEFVGPPTISGGQIHLNWIGTSTLESATSVTGSWTPITGATSPYSEPASGTKFFRLNTACP